MDSSLKEKFGRLERDQGEGHVPSGSPRVLQLIRGDDWARIRTIDAIILLKRRGPTLLRAKRAVEAAVEHGRTLIELPLVESEDAVLAELRDAGFEARFVAEEQEVNVASLRQRLDMTLEGFATAYGFDVRAVRDWEAGRGNPGPAHPYLQAIANDPVGVMEAYAGVSAPR